jgi:electron transfer flavoprotein beta subunit
MRVLVLLEVGADVRIPPERDPRSGRVRAEWLVREIDAASARALDLALALKATQPATGLTLVHWGPPEAEAWLRPALARGADRALRIWDETAAGVHVAGKALILAAAAQVAGFDLVLAGAAGVVNSEGQLGVLVAAHLGAPCVTQVVGVGPQGPASDAAQTVALTRGLDKGFREHVEVGLPAIATVSAGGSSTEVPAPAVVPVGALLAARAAEIPAWDLADLGVPLERVRRADQQLRYGPPRPRRPRLYRLAAPDPTLPAFDRILKLVQGSVQRREGRVVRQPAEAIVDEVLRTLRDEGWLDHLRSGGAERGARSGNADPSDATDAEAGGSTLEAGKHP